MAILQDDDARFKGLERKVGWFVLVAILGIVIAVVSIGIQQDVFSPKTRVFFVTDSGQDINEGMAVKLSGFVIGKVKKLELTDDARVKVTLSLLREYMKWVRGDSRARLLKEGVIGATVIDITPGTETTPVLARDSQIAFERERGLGQIVDQLYAEVIPLIEDMKRVLDRADTVLAGLPATQKKLDTALDSATRNLQSLEKVTATDLPAITRKGRETLDSAKKVVDSVSKTWPVSRHIEQPRSETLPVDSYSGSGVSKQK